MSALEQATATIPTTHAAVRSWVAQMVELCTPESVYWCDGSQQEYEALCERLVEAGTFLPLNPRYADIDWTGLEGFGEEQFNARMGIDREVWQQEILSHDELFFKLYDRLPKELIFIRELILSSLWRAPEHWEVLS